MASMLEPVLMEILLIDIRRKWKKIGDAAIEIDIKIKADIQLKWENFISNEIS